MTVAEGHWRGWFVSLEVTDEVGRTVARASKDSGVLEQLVPRMLDDAGEAIAENFLATRRRPPIWTEPLRGLFVSYVSPLRNHWLRRRFIRARQRAGSRGA